ncbi:MAG: hypothetical protein O2815_01780 [Actinomycetota bacterium]|nr:hypothetical protein [Actinomycetota bacterium]
MAGKKRPKKGQLPPGVKGPAPQPNNQRPSNPPAGTPRGNLERASIPFLSRLLAMPRWLLVVLIASCLLLGLALTGPLAPVGALFLLIVGTFLGWLLMLAWPVLPVGRRMIRLVVVFALVGLAVLKALGRF